MVINAAALPQPPPLSQPAASSKTKTTTRVPRRRRGEDCWPLSLRLGLVSTGLLYRRLGYVLSEMEDGKPFSEVVRTAKDLGFTEPGDLRLGTCFRFCLDGETCESVCMVAVWYVTLYAIAWCYGIGKCKFLGWSIYFFEACVRVLYRGIWARPIKRVHIFVSMHACFLW
ncbi:hypothetical protein Droror1_Dr00013128 [Drosera rotundifolia]